MGQGRGQAEGRRELSGGAPSAAKAGCCGMLCSPHRWAMVKQVRSENSFSMISSTWA